jgi:hypothetical protein
MKLWQKRLRREPLKEGTIEFICHNPHGDQWKIFKAKSTAPYHPETLWNEIQSWPQELKVNTNRDELSYRHIWDEDEDGLVDPHALRQLVDGERFGILLQAKDNPEDIEQSMEPMKADNGIQRFIKRTRWRRRKSKFDAGVRDDFTCPNADAQREGLRPGYPVDVRSNRKLSPATEGGR